MDWNVIVSVHQGGYKRVRQLLHEYGEVGKTDYYNILTMKVGDIHEFMEDLRTLYEMHTPALADIGHVMPVTEHFHFQTPEAFEAQAKAIVHRWLDELAGRRFFVRMHRRGFKGRLSSQREERFLDEFVLEALGREDKPQAKVDFAHAQRVIAVETLGQEAGLSLWREEQLARYPFLNLE